MLHLKSKNYRLDLSFVIRYLYFWRINCEIPFTKRAPCLFKNLVYLLSSLFQTFTIYYSGCYNNVSLSKYMSLCHHDLTIRVSRSNSSGTSRENQKIQKRKLPFSDLSPGYSSNYPKLLNYPRFTRIAWKFFRNDFYPECNIRWRSVRSLRVRGQEITFPIITQRAVWSSCVVGSLLFQADSFFRSRGKVRRGASATTWLGLNESRFPFRPFARSFEPGYRASLINAILRVQRLQREESITPVICFGQWVIMIDTFKRTIASL